MCSLYYRSEPLHSARNVNSLNGYVFGHSMYFKFANLTWLADTNTQRQIMIIWEALTDYFVSTSCKEIDNLYRSCFRDEILLNSWFFPTWSTGCSPWDSASCGIRRRRLSRRRPLRSPPVWSIYAATDCVSQRSKNIKRYCNNYFSPNFIGKFPGAKVFGPSTKTIKYVWAGSHGQLISDAVKFC